MDYKRIHDSIIEQAKNRELTGYTETHHIIPKCLGGTNDSTNLVKLTAREHFIIHKLLCEIYPNERGIVYAFWNMSNVRGNDRHDRHYRISNREYERLRLKVAELSSELHKGMVPVIDSNGNRIKVSIDHPDFINGTLEHINLGERNGMYQMTGSLNHFYGKTHSDESRKKIGEASKRMWKAKREELIKVRNEKIDFRGGKNPASKRIRCLQTNCCDNMIYDTLTETAEAHDIHICTVIKNAKGRTRTMKFEYVKT